MQHRSQWVTVLRWVLLGIVLLWSAVPIVLAIVSSFKVPSTIFEVPPRLFFKPTLSNYLKLYQDFPEFFHDLGNSAVVTLGATLLTLIVSVPAAYAYSRYQRPGFAASAFSMLAIRMFPPIIITIPLYPVVRTLGLNDTYFILIILYSVFFVSLATWVMKAFIDEIPRELDDAARIDGCSVLQLLTRIILPLSRHGIVATAVFVIVFAWKEFLFAFLFTSSDARTAPIVIKEMLGSVSGVQWGPLLAAATLQLLPILVFVLFVQRYLMSGLTIGSVKG